MGIDMSINIYLDMCAHRHACMHMCVDLGLDMYIDMCIDLCTDRFVGLSRQACVHTRAQTCV